MQDVIGEGDRAAQVFEQLAHGRHVADVWDVREAMDARGQEAGGHLLEDSILGAVGGHRARKGSIRGDLKPAHPFSIAESHFISAIPLVAS